MTPRRLATILALFFAALGVAPAMEASAATFDVTSCDAAPNGSNNHAWTYSETSTGRFVHGNGCAAAPGGEYSGLYVREDLNQNANVPGGESAYWRFDATPGTTITTVSYSRYLRTYLNEGWRSEFLADVTPLEQCFIGGGEECNWGTEGGQGITFSGLAASSLRVGARCQPTSPATGCTDGATLQRVIAVLYGATVTVSDPAAPTIPALAGQIASPAWQRGTRTATFSAVDATGIKDLQLRRGGTTAATDTRTCDYTRPAPCSSPGVSTAASWTSVDTNTWPDGEHQLTGRATDAADNVATTTPITVRIDNTAPSAPAPTADPVWSAAADGSWSWTVPPETDRAPIDQVEIEICHAGDCDTQTTNPGAGPFSVNQPVDEGITTLRARHRDAAGNLGAWSAPVPVRRDRADPPALTSVSDTGWRPSTALPVSWTLPAQDAGAPWSSIELELCPPSPGICDVQNLAAASGNGTATTVVGEGTVRSRLVDEAGNAGPWSAPRPTRTDLAAPPMPNLGIPQAQPDGTYALSVALNDPGPAPVATLAGDVCRVGSAVCEAAEISAGASTLTTGTLAAGSWRVRLRATDAAGNTGAYGEQTITVGPAATATPTVTASPSATPAETSTPTPEPTPTATVAPPAKRVAPRLRIRSVKLFAKRLRIRVTATPRTTALRLVYRARVDGATRTFRRRLQLRQGRAVARVKIPAGARAPRARVTVRYAGSDDYQPAIVSAGVRRTPKR